MKRRFVVVVFLFFVTAYAALSFLQFRYFEQERMALIDQQIDRTVSDLLSADLSTTRLETRDQVEDVILDALESEPLNQVILLRVNDQLIYRNHAAEVLGLNSLEGSGRVTEFNGHRIRFRSLALPGQKAYLQIGIALDQRELSWREIRLKILLWSIFVCLTFAALAGFLGNYLLRPVNELAAYFAHQALRPEEKIPMPTLAKTTTEFRRLGDTVDKLTNRWRELLAHQNAMLARLVHEIRTPLTIVQNKVEMIQARREGADSRLTEEVLAELKHLETLTGDFMAWSRIEYSRPAGDDVYAISPLDFVTKLDVVAKAAGRIRIESVALSEGAKIFAKPEHLRLILDNLLGNAIRYGVKEQPITLRLTDSSLAVSSFGAPVPSTVLENLGKPFNRGGDHPDATGLGLANVMSVCKKYAWDLAYERVGEENVWRVTKINFLGEAR